jgi:late competence protein required for DNA uptake (superfamily II DNA/RNA helicase)
MNDTNQENNFTKLDPTVVCQSCGATVYFKEDLGLEANGSYSEKYCRYCLEFGRFVDEDRTFEDKLDVIKTLLIEDDDLSEEEAEKQAFDSLADLERWKKAAEEYKAKN